MTLQEEQKIYEDLVIELDYVHAAFWAAEEKLEGVDDDAAEVLIDIIKKLSDARVTIANLLSNNLRKQL